MKKLILTGFLACLALGLTAVDAEAARMGGGKSVGMQRQSVAPKPATPAQAAPAPAPAAPAAAPATAPKRNWLGPLAGLAAGFGIAALFSHFGLGAELANFFMLALLLLAAFFIFKLLFRRPAPNAPSARGVMPPMEYAAAPPSPLNPAPAVAEPTLVPAHIPAGFDSQGFLHVAKLNFVRLQAANDAKDLDAIREFTCPEVFAELKMQIDERGDEHNSAPQKTEVVSLDAALLEVSTEGRQHIASVRFSGLIRETAGSKAVPFCEIWNLSKATDSDQGWVIAGIQQVD